ncbi:MAG: D-Ala-D-Ala carboxypeptidase family metallohydrolase [Candidatus Binatia bacterium]
MATRYSPEIAPFLIQVNDERLIHRINSAFALPGETMTLSVGETSGNNEYVVQTALATVQTGPNTWTWKAPREVGIYPVHISHSDGDIAIQLNVFVMVPLALAKDGSLNGYRIGYYPTKARRQLFTYPPPRGLIEVTEANENTQVSPHFKLRQFLCKQESAYPKYIALDPRLLVVLEAILLKINEQGHHSPTLSIMSGYRTPYYNRAIGNSTTYSRHLWGDAADIFVDSNPQDGEMDDFNNDGVINIHDTEALHSIVSKMYEPRASRFLAGSFFNEPILQQLVINGYTDDTRLQKLLTGGLARYRATSSHGPFVHIDVRGIFTRWGQ